MPTTLRFGACRLRLAAGMAAVLAAGSPGISTAETFSLSASMQAGTNPSGQWEYGETAGFGGAFTRYLPASRTTNHGVAIWMGANPFASTPTVYFNPTAAAVSLGTPIYESHTAGFHPGLGDRVSTVRFTAKRAGAHLVEAALFGQDSRGTTTEVGVFVNGLQQGTLVPVNGFGPTSVQLLKRTLLAQPGDHIDVSVGNRGNVSNDSTQIDLRITDPGDAYTPTLRGYADIHNHAFANLAFGGKFLYGSAHGPESAVLSVDGDIASHGLIHGNEIIGAGMDGRWGLFLGNNGAPNLGDWPTHRDTDHQKVYKDWLARAVKGGMRLMVIFAVDSPKLCLSVGNDGRNCGDEAPTLEAQLREARAMQAEIDAEAGGNELGFFRVVKTPLEARIAIGRGQLAVVLGVESLNSLGIQASSARIAQLHALGVRHVFPIHQADNSVGGASFFEARVQGQTNHADPPFLNFDVDYHFAKIAGRYPITTEDCPELEKYGRCNVFGLNANGKLIVEELMRAGMLVDVDHMSRKSFSDTLDIAERFGAPAVASHAGFNDVNHSGGRFTELLPLPHPRPSDQDHEGQLTAAKYHRVLDSGGMVGVILAQGRDIRDVQTYQRAPGKATIPHRCGRSSETFAQGYLYAVDQSGGQAVAFGTDINTPSLLQPSPRFGPGACGGGTDTSLPGWGPRLAYPFASQFSAGMTMPPMTDGQRTFDFNTDGFATIGQFPDLIADLSALGVPAQDIEPLFHSAEAYIRMWEKAEAAALSSSMLRRPVVTVSPSPFKADQPVAIKVTVVDAYFGTQASGGAVWVNGVAKGALGDTFTMTFKSRIVKKNCHMVTDPPDARQPRPKPHQDCEQGKVADAVRIDVKGVPQFLDADPLFVDVATD